MAAGITGIDNLKTWLQNCINPSRIDIYLGNKPAGGVWMSCCLDKGDLIDQVENIFCTMVPGPNATKFFTICVMQDKKKDPIAQTTFAKEFEKNESNLVVNGPSTQIQQQQMDPKTFEMIMEFGELKSENKRLHEKNQELNFKIAEMNAQLDEAEAQIGEIEDPIEKYLPMFMPMLGKLFGAPTNTVNGVEDMELTGIISELQTIDPNFKQNMFLLLKLAKNKPTIYKMAVSQLNSL
jgi:hypothetical protein